MVGQLASSFKSSPLSTTLTIRVNPSAAASAFAPLTRLPIQYADYTHWQRQWLQGEALTAQLGYWQQQLAGGPRPAGIAH